ncbi:MAG: amino acid ABC transporter permease [Ruminococcaceae bacterium]|nr:amino acid ABC transporter permease [Oscillospiraceae bacterium]
MEFWPLIYELCEGFSLTLKLFALTLVFSIPLGFICSFAAMSPFKPLSWLMNGIIWIVRGTPLLLQCIIVTFIPSTLLDMPNKDFAAMLHIDTMADLQFLFVLIAFSLNYACYFAVIFEGGIKNVSVGQHEAGQVLGMTKGQIFRHVILMQVVRKITAPMSNEIITLVKDTALARALSVVEIIAVAYQNVNKFAVLSPLIYASVFYLAFSGILTIVFHLVEKKLSYYTV